MRGSAVAPWRLKPAEDEDDAVFGGFRSALDEDEEFDDLEGDEDDEFDDDEDDDVDDDDLEDDDDDDLIDLDDEYDDADAEERPHPGKFDE